MNHFYLGCDVSKGYADFIILDSDKNVVEDTFSLDDAITGHTALHGYLLNFFSQRNGTNPDLTLFAAVESTGGLENNWLNLFYQLGTILNIKAARVNPKGIKALHKASLQRNVTDSISAKNIAEYLIAFPEKVVYNQDDPFYALRRQWNFVQLLKKQKTRLLNYLSINLYTALPFLVKYCKNGVPNWMLNLLRKYSCVDELLAAGESSLSKIPYVSKKRARDIIEDAKNCVASANDLSTAFVIKSLVEQILQHKKTIEAQVKFMEARCKHLPEIKLLTSFKGIGPYSALGLLLNIGSVGRFADAKKLVAYFGLHPVYKQSGDGSWNYHMSKQGRSAPRAILFMVCRSAIFYNPLIKEVYIDNLKKGKSNRVLGTPCREEMFN